MKKRSIIVAIALLLLAVSIVSGAKAKKQITVWGFSHTSDCLKQIKTMYEQKNPNVEVKIVEQGWGEMRTKALAAIASGKSVPDVIIISSAWAGPMMTSRGLAPLNRYLDQDFKKKIFPEALKIYNYQGNQYGVPLDIDLSPIIYRKDIVNPVLSELGMKEFPKDWDSLLRLLGKLTVDKNKDGIIDQWGLVMEHGVYYLQSVFLVQRNGRLFSPDYQKALVNSPKMVEAVSDYASLFRDKKALLYSGTEGTGSIAGLLKSGQAVMYIQGPWYRSELEANCPEQKGKWAFAPMPVKYPAAPSTALTGICMAVPYNAKNVPEAANFIKFFTGDVAAQTAYFKYVGSPSPLMGLLDNSFYRIKLDYFGDELIYPALMEGVKNGVAIETFPRQEMSERLLKALDEVCFNGRDPKAALDEAQMEIRSMLP